MPTKIITKNGSGTPAASALDQGELAVDLTNKKLFTSTNGTDIVEVGEATFARVCWNGGVLYAEKNISSVVINGIGDYTVNFTTAASGNRYIVTTGIGQLPAMGVGTVASMAAASFDFETYNTSTSAVATFGLWSVVVYED